MTRAVVLSLALIVVSRAAAHADGGDAITWDAPAGCPDADAVRAQIAAQLGRALEPGDVDVRLQVSHDGATWRVDMTAAGGERSLEAATCDELAQSAALIVAMTIDEAAAAAAEVATAEPEDDAPPEPAPRHRAEIDVSERTPEEKVPWTVRARAFVIGDLGTMPEPAVGAGGAASVALGAWGVEVAAARFRSQHANASGSTEGAQVDLSAITTRLCYTGSRRRLAWRGCFGAEVEIVGARGEGFQHSLGNTTTFGFGPHFGVGWAYRLIGPLAARVDVATNLLVVRPVLVEGNMGAVIHDPNVLCWRGVASLEAAW